MTDKKYNAFLWTNDKKNNDKAPDFKGEIEINGEKLQAAAWIKTARNNKKYISLNLGNNQIKKTKEFDREEAIKNIEELSTKNIKTSSQASKASQSFNPSKKMRGNIFENANEIPKTQEQPVIMQSDGGTKKTPPTYARYIDEPLGSRSDFIKDKKRSGK